MYTSSSSLSTLAAGAGAAAFLFFSVLIGGADVYAQSGFNGASFSGTSFSGAQFIEPSRGSQDGAFSGMPELPLMHPRMDAGDEAAALEAVEIALTQAGDGATYVWQRGNGRLAGAIRMTSTFRDADGRICRHLEMQMRHGTYARKTEGIACRDTDGVWLLEG